MKTVKTVANFSPAIVVALWALLVALDVVSKPVRVVLLVMLAISLAIHIAEERRRLV